MKKNEKRAEFLEKTDAPNTNVITQMQNNNNPTAPNFQPQRFSDAQLEILSRREMLELTKISRLPPLPKRANFEIPKFEPSIVRVADAPESCVNCDARLTEFNHKISASVCATCLSIYTKIVCEIDRTADEKANAAKLLKFGGLR